MKGNGINVIRVSPSLDPVVLELTSLDSSLLRSAIHSELIQASWGTVEADLQSYGTFKSLLSTWSGEQSLSAPLRLLAGAGAGIVAVCKLALTYRRP
jgi:hypothetical protein